MLRRSLLVFGVALAASGCRTPSSFRDQPPDEVREYSIAAAPLVDRLLNRVDAGTSSQSFVPTDRTVRGNAIELGINIGSGFMGPGASGGTLEVHEIDSNRARVELRPLHGLFGTSIDEEALWRIVDECAGQRRPGGE